MTDIYFLQHFDDICGDDEAASKVPVASMANTSRQKAPTAATIKVRATVASRPAVRRSGEIFSCPTQEEKTRKGKGRNRKKGRGGFCKYRKWGSAGVFRLFWGDSSLVQHGVIVHLSRGDTIASFPIDDLYSNGDFSLPLILSLLR